MGAAPLVATASVRVDDYRCAAGPGDRPFPEVHHDHSVSYVRRGSFGCTVRGRAHELVPGSVLVGRTGDEFICTHEHVHGGDECLAFHLSDEFVEALGGDPGAWIVGALPPLPELMVLGELAQLSAEGRSDVAVDEAGLAFAARVVEVACGVTRAARVITGRDRRRAVESAVWIDENANAPLDLETIAAEAGISAFHFLRMFSAVLGVTPHQYLVRARLRRAARLLVDADLPITEVALEVGFGDLSNFVRTFRRAAGSPPLGFRRSARGERSGRRAKDAAPRTTA